MKCNFCKHNTGYILGVDEGGYPEQYCAKKHWYGTDGAIPAVDPWADCKDFEQDVMKEVSVLMDQYTHAIIRMQMLMKKEAGLYPMGKPQPAQIDCRKTDCMYHQNAACHNPAPVVTLNENDKFVCWSFKKEENA